MSFSRFGWYNSDVYVFEHVGGYIQCCGCALPEFNKDDEIFATVDLKTPKQALEHLSIHKDAGHNVDRAMQGITEAYPDLDVEIDPYVKTEEQNKRDEEIWERFFTKDSDE
jgi:hypothetical protein